MVSLQDVSENGGGGKKTINQCMVEEGLARVSKRADKVVGRLGVPAAAALVGEMKEAQEGARRGRVGMWRYGDVADSDDEGYGF
jgi:endonuclease YncB( thermonuclease family)